MYSMRIEQELGTQSILRHLLEKNFFRHIIDINMVNRSKVYLYLASQMRSNGMGKIAKTF